jgi:predicted metalloprotease with PDZ domain
MQHDRAKDERRREGVQAPSARFRESNLKGKMMLNRLMATSAAFALLAPAALAAQEQAAASAPVTGVRYQVEFTRENSVRRTMRVEMSFETQGTAPVLLSLPSWTPGAYEISNFAQWVSEFSATGAGGTSAPLKWDKVDHDTWRVVPAPSGRTTVSFDFLADSLDNAMAWARSDFLFFNGTNVFMYPEGRGFDWGASVTVRTDSAWKVVSGMQPAQQSRTYSAANYHDLVDMPFFVGRFDVDSAMVEGKWMRLATYPTASVAGSMREAVWDQLKRFVPVQSKVFGETPWDTYTVMQIADDAFGGASGLEHQNSHVNVITPFAIGHPFMASLYAHEIFHAWNVKRLRPATLWPYRYDGVQSTTLLWVSEGITDYYADLTIVRSGLADSTALLGLTTEKINEVTSLPAVALEDASLSTWIQPRDGTGTIYYPKGALAGFLLDIMIRDATDNAASLDDVMRELYNSTYKQNRGFTGEEWWSTVSRVAGGKSFTDFHTRFIDGREAFPWSEVLPLGGFRIGEDTLREPRLGIATMADTGGLRVEQVEPASAAALAGVRVGDYVLAIGEIMLTDPEFMEKFRAKYSSGTEAVVPVMVKRGAQTVNLSARAPLEIRVQRTLQAAPDATEKAARIRRGIFTGTTGAGG